MNFIKYCVGNPSHPNRFQSTHQGFYISVNNISTGPKTKPV